MEARWRSHGDGLEARDDHVGVFADLEQLFEGLSVLGAIELLQGLRAHACRAVVELGEERSNFVVQRLARLLLALAAPVLHRTVSGRVAALAAVQALYDTSVGEHVPAVLASVPHVVTERSVELCQLPQLLPLVLVLVLLHRHEQLLHHCLGLLQRLIVVCGQQHMEGLFLVVVGSQPSPAVLHGALASKRHLRSRLPLHLLLSDAARPKNEADEVVAGVLVHRDVELELAAN
mmetsp:Transcript_22451/g.88867  ORF Transcript_22451/g.88867 Transcript_22451/m.88867 type:complete len:233 (+) Transcript_22451:253-951(+)